MTETIATGVEGFCRPQIAVDFGPTLDGSAWRDWQSHLSSGGRIDLLDPEAAPAFLAAARLYMLGPVILSDSMASHPMRSVRTAEYVVRSGLDHILISLHLEGYYEGRCGKQPYRAGTGDVCFLDYGRTFDIQISPYRSLAIMIPRLALPEAMRRRELHGFVPPAEAPATMLLARTFRDFYAALPQLTTAQGTAGINAIIELADLASQNEAGARKAKPAAALDLLGRAQILIERNLEDAALSVASIARDLHVSRNALYAAFAASGGVASYIQERRLQRCYEIFNSSLRADETIGAVALACGFRNEAHFSRTFKKRFGLGPRALRAIARHGRVFVEPARAAVVAPHMLQTLGR